MGALEALLWAAQGETGEGHRTCPSASARFPLATTVVTTRVAGVAEGVCRWEPERGRLGVPTPGGVAGAVEAAGIGSQPWIADAAAVIVLSADLAAARAAFADQPPAGERGARYAWLEAGAAAQNALLHATEQGLGAVLVAGFDDDALRAVGLLPPGHDPLALVAVGVTSG